MLPIKSSDVILFLYTENFVEFEILKKQLLHEFEVHYYPDLEKFRNDNRKKIAIFLYVENVENLTCLPLIKDMSSVDLLVLYHWDELIKTPEKIHQDIIQSFNTEKYIVIAGGYNMQHQYDKKKFITNNFSHGHITTQRFSESTNYKNKIYDFECLFGTSKPARRYLYYKLLENNFIDQSIINLEGWVREDWLNDINHNIFWPDISKDLEEKYGTIDFYRSDIISSLEPFEVNSLANNLPEFFLNVINQKELDNTCHFNRGYSVPTRVYDITKYSLVAETYQEHVFCPTEKTAKMFLGKRIFVMFSCFNFLKNLKDMGFKTFDGIIDESYDNIVDTRKRFDVAFEQVKYLSTCDYSQLQKDTEDIREHNYHVLLDSNRNFEKIKKHIYENI